MKRINILIAVVTILWSCNSSKKEPDPCYVGTFQSMEYSSGNIKKSSTIELRNDGTGRITDPMCNNSLELVIDFTFKKIDIDYYSIKPISIYYGGKLVTDYNQLGKLAKSTYDLIGYINYETEAVFSCVNNDLLINSEGFAAHIPDPLWKRK